MELDQIVALQEIMAECGRGLFNDCEANVAGCGFSAFEAAFPLNEVAKILGIDGPTEICDALYEAEDGA